uniref:Uncharacterized protein n=2 Tax=Wuchereria bancrofti TaxID=6293 RepID=A0A1I8ED40_WUCBA
MNCFICRQFHDSIHHLKLSLNITVTVSLSFQSLVGPTSSFCSKFLVLAIIWQLCISTLSENLLCYSGVNNKVTITLCDSNTEFCYKQVMPNDITVMDCDRSKEFGFCKAGIEGCEQRHIKGQICCCTKSKCNACEQAYMKHFTLTALIILIDTGRFFYSL